MEGLNCLSNNVSRSVSRSRDGSHFVLPRLLTAYDYALSHRVVV